MKYDKYILLNDNDCSRGRQRTSRADGFVFVLRDEAAAAAAAGFWQTLMGEWRSWPFQELIGSEELGVRNLLRTFPSGLSSLGAQCT